MLILLFFQTRIYSLRFNVTEPLVLFSASGFRPLHPSSLAQIKKACALEKWRHCVSAFVFLSGIWFTLILVFTGRCRCSEWQKTSNDVCMNSVKFISHSACIFNVVRFVYYKVHFVISVT